MGERDDGSGALAEWAGAHGDFLDCFSGRSIRFGWHTKYYADIRIVHCLQKRNSLIIEWRSDRYALELELLMVARLR